MSGIISQLDENFPYCGLTLRKDAEPIKIPRGEVLPEFLPHKPKGNTSLVFGQMWVPNLIKANGSINTP